MIEICLIVIAVCALLETGICIANFIQTSKTINKQVVQLGEDVRFQRDIAQKNMELAQKKADEAKFWMDIANASKAKANGTAFDSFVRELRSTFNGIEDKNSERAKVVAGLITQMEDFSKACNKTYE